MSLGLRYLLETVELYCSLAPMVQPVIIQWDIYQNYAPMAQGARPSQSLLLHVAIHLCHVFQVKALKNLEKVLAHVLLNCSFLFYINLKLE